MVDLHFDLLSILYGCYKKNDFSYADTLREYFNDENVDGVVANLYFMSKDAMEKEIGDEVIDVEKMFEVSSQLFKQYFKDVKVMFSIEGCDYIEDVETLERLKENGLQSILLVWNNQNKYGSGTKAEEGLTDLGRDFLKKAIELGLVIDTSHMNEETFWATITLVKEEIKKGSKVKVMASHSNCKELYEHPRNLDDEQMKALKEVGGIMGLVPYSYFLSDKIEDNDVLKRKYLEHIGYAINIMGVDNVAIATDDMSFDKYLFGNEISQVVFPYESLKKDLEALLETKYSKDIVEKIMRKNSEKIFN